MDHYATVRSCHRTFFNLLYRCVTSVALVESIFSKLIHHIVLHSIGYSAHLMRGLSGECVACDTLAMILADPPVLLLLLVKVFSCREALLVNKGANVIVICCTHRSKVFTLPVDDSLCYLLHQKLILTQLLGIIPFLSL